MLINAGADVVEQLGDILNLVEQNRQTDLVQQPARVGTGAGLDVRILQQNISGLRKQLTEE